MIDDIANIVLKKTKDILIPYLGPIYWVTFELKKYPQHWKTYDSIILRMSKLHASKVIPPNSATQDDCETVIDGGGRRHQLYH